jgi:hypothetical protein
LTLVQIKRKGLVQKRNGSLQKVGEELLFEIGATGFEPATSRSRSPPELAPRSAENPEIS